MADVSTRSPARDVPPAGRTLPELLERRARDAPDSPLIASGDVRRTSREARDAVAARAGVLAAAGVGPDDRVAMLCANSIELLETILACAWLGAAAVPINTAARGPHLAHVLANAEPRILLADPELVDRLDVLDAPVPGLERVWTPSQAPRTRWRDVPVLRAPAPGGGAPPHAVAPQDTLAIIYTSGTTGPPKGVCCPHAQMFWWGVLVGEQLRIGAGDVLYTVLPLFHTNALNAFMQALVNGASFAFGRRFSASRFWDEVRSARATVTYLLGSMVHILLKQPPSAGDRDHRLRVALSPATPAAAVTEFAERFGVELVDGYGSTETNLVMATTFGGPAGSMGVPAPEFETRVVDDGDAEVPAGTPGELLVRPREPFSIATGYFRDDANTVAAWRNLWFHTGDRVRRDADGAFHFVDRLKDTIRRRGENISSFEVEQALLSHPAVAQAAAVPVPSIEAEEEVMVFVVPARGDVKPHELIGHCEPRLPYFAVPRYVEFVDALPLTENGKVRKTELRARGVSAATWDRERATRAAASG